MGLVGGDVSALLNFASEVQRRQERIEQATHRLSALVEQAQWVGPDRDRFLQDWNGLHRPSLLSAATELAERAVTITRHAHEQAEASQ